MGLGEYFQKQLNTEDKIHSRQISHVLSQLNTDTEEPQFSDEDPTAEESEDDISCYEEESDKVVYEAKGAMGEELLASEFLANIEEAVEQSKTISQIWPDVKEEEKRPITPIRGSVGTIDSRIPSAMRSKPKIPRTPILEDKIPSKKDEENSKKNEVKESVRKVDNNKKEMENLKQKQNRSEVKNRVIEERKGIKEIKKEHLYGVARKDKQVIILIMI